MRIYAILLLVATAFLKCSSSPTNLKKSEEYYRNLYSGYTKITIETRNSKSRAVEEYLTLERIKFNDDEYEILINVRDLYLDTRPMFSNTEEFVTHMVNLKKKNEPLVILEEDINKHLSLFKNTCKSNFRDNHLSSKEIIEKYYNKDHRLKEELINDEFGCLLRKILLTDEVYIADDYLYYFNELPEEAY